MSKTPQTEIQRFYKGIPILDAKISLHVQPDAEDIRAAKPKDPERCAYALCLKRTLHAAEVRIFKQVAYVEMLNEAGRREIQRFTIGPKAQKVIEAIDTDKPVEPGGFTFDRPRPSHTLAKKLEYQANFKAGRVHHRGPYKMAKPRNHVLSSIRSGTGMIHLVGKDPATKTRWEHDLK